MSKPRSQADIIQDMINVGHLRVLTKLQLAVHRAGTKVHPTNRVALDFLAHELKVIADDWEAEMKERSNAP